MHVPPQPLLALTGRRACLGLAGCRAGSSSRAGFAAPVARVGRADTRRLPVFMPQPPNDDNAAPRLARRMQPRPRRKCPLPNKTWRFA